MPCRLSRPLTRMSLKAWYQVLKPKPNIWRTSNHLFWRTWIWWVSMVNWVWPPTPVNSDLFQDWIYIFLGSWIPFWTFCLELGATGSPKINMFSPRNHLNALKCLVFPHLISLHPFFSCDAPEGGGLSIIAMSVSKNPSVSHVSVSIKSFWR